MIDDIHGAIAEEFSHRKIVPYNIRMDLPEMFAWSERISSAHNLDLDEFSACVKEIYWGAVSLQLNVGHTLLSLNETSLPSGIKGESDNMNINHDHQIADIHYWYHASHCWESIYRMWERIVSIFEERFTPNLKRNYYFDGYVNLLTIEGVVFQTELRQLQRYLKSWNKIAAKRNEISHGRFNPFINLKLDVATNGILDEHGELPLRVSYEYPNLKQEVNTIINYCEKTFELIDLMVAVCELRIQPRRNINEEMSR